MNLKIPLLVIGATICMNILPASADYCLTGAAANIEQAEQDIQNGVGNITPSYTNDCAGGTRYAWGAYVENDSGTIQYLVYECICPKGYTEVSSNIGVCTNMQHVTSCKCSCSSCTSDSSFSNYSTGYQRKANRSCDCSSGTATCKTTYQYRCAAGYYGSSSNGTSGCTKCTSSGTSDAGDNATQSKCYLTAGTSMSDTTGTYTCSAKSYYQ